jgi:hypothetical protein
VKVADDNQCYTMSDNKIIPTNKAAMDDFEIPAKYLINEGVVALENAKIYPVPTQGPATIEINNEVIGVLSITVVDPAGKEIRKITLQKTTVNFSTEVDMSDVPKGIYMVKLLIGNQIATMKLIVE